MLQNGCKRFTTFFQKCLPHFHIGSTFTLDNITDMSIKKQFLKTKPQANVTFQLPAEAAPKAEKVTLVGDFNGWDKIATEMKKLKTGVFKATVKLETGKEYQFRYLIDGETWENDWEADKYVPNELTFEENSVVAL